MNSLLNPGAPNSPASTSALNPGQVVGGGRYRLKQLVGQGGMGVVWLAYDTRLREPVALKFLPSQISHDAAALDDLRRETMRSRKLSHPNIVRIHDLNETPGEPTFISMEYINGPDLHHLRAKRPAKVLPWKFLAPLVRQLCSALQYAHGEGIVHRDLKPANLMLEAGERLKLADFGVACAVSDSIARISGQQPVRGTLDFMSPQQADGKKPQRADDIYSLGATLYDLLTSRPPFYTGAIGYQVRNTRPEPMAHRLIELELANEIPSEVSALVMACLAKEPEQRPPAVIAILEWLDAAETSNSEVLSAPAQSSEDVPAPTPAAATPPPEIAPPSSATAPAPDPVATPEAEALVPIMPAERSPISLRLALIVLAITGIGLGGWWLLKNKPQSSSLGPGQALSTSKTDPAVSADGFESLFNGRDLTGWSGDLQYWFVRDGTIAGHAGGNYSVRQPTCLIWKAGDVRDFELRLAVRFTSGNTGIYYRGRDLGGWNVGGYQFEIFSSNTGNLLDNGTDRIRRDIARRQKGANEMAVFKKREWNNVVITAQGNRLTHKINGQLVAAVTDSDSSGARSGVLAFELYAAGTEVEFKDIRLKRF